MKLKSVCILVFSLLFTAESLYSQLIIDENSDFWICKNRGGVFKGKYILKINQSDIWNLNYLSQSNDIKNVNDYNDYYTRKGLQYFNIVGFWEETLELSIGFATTDNMDGSVDTSTHEDALVSGFNTEFRLNNQLHSFYHIIILDSEKDVGITIYGSLYPVDGHDGYPQKKYNVSRADYLIAHEKVLKEIDEKLRKFIVDNFEITAIGGNPDSGSEKAVEYVAKDGSATGEDGNVETATWVKVVGGAAALAVAMALVAKIFKARPNKPVNQTNKPETKKEDKQKKEPEYIYILQLNKNMLEVGPSKTDKLVVTAWRVDSAGNRVLAKDATFQVSTTEPDLAVSSTLGSGQCVAGLSLKPSGQFKEAVITIKALAGGKALQASAKATCTQQLTLIVDGPTPLTFINGKKFQEALFEKQKDETVGEWVFKPFFLWFTDDPNPTIDPDRTKPVKPPFKPIFTIEAIPDVLEISPPVYHGENVWKADVKLIAEKSVDTNWLFTDGKININITVEEQKVN
jgi:hypothetical protein